MARMSSRPSPAALECVAAAGLGLGPTELDSKLRSGRTLIALAPLRESGYRLLMEVLARRDLLDLNTEGASV